jgi:hypothetical protein
MTPKRFREAGWRPVQTTGSAGETDLVRTGRIGVLPAGEISGMRNISGLLKPRLVIFTAGFIVYNRLVERGLI